MKIPACRFLLAALLACGCGGGDDDGGGAPQPSTSIGSFAMKGNNTAADVSAVQTKMTAAETVSDGAVAATIGTASTLLHRFVPPALTDTDPEDSYEALAGGFSELESGGECSAFFESLQSGFDAPSQVEQMKVYLENTAPAKLEEYGCSETEKDAKWLFSYSCTPPAEGSGEGAEAFKPTTMTFRAGSNDDEVALEYGATMDWSGLSQEGNGSMVMTMESGLHASLSAKTVAVGFRMKMDISQNGRAQSMDTATKVTFTGGTKPSVRAESVASGTNPETNQPMAIQLDWSLTQESENVVKVAMSGTVPAAGGAPKALSFGGTITRTGDTCSFQKD